LQLFTLFHSKRIAPRLFDAELLRKLRTRVEYKNRALERRSRFARLAIRANVTLRNHKLADFACAFSHVLFSPISNMDEWLKVHSPSAANCASEQTIELSFLPPY
jgi:hypothetical protein